MKIEWKLIDSIQFVEVKDTHFVNYFEKLLQDVETHQMTDLFTNIKS